MMPIPICIVICILCSIVTLFFTFLITDNCVSRDWERESVARGHAKYVKDEDGDTEFKWNDE